MPTRSIRILTLLVIASALLVVKLMSPGTAGPPPGGGEAAILEAYEEGRSGVRVVAAAVVDRVLADDVEGTRHQRFIVELPGGHTVLISHNVDLAPRVPLSTGDFVRVCGQYEWNDRGGVIHWTHHDPRGEHDEGWIEYEGRRYR